MSVLQKMRIVEFNAHIIRLPLKRKYKHASATRESSDNLVVRCKLADGTEGWGEGVPRDYVTGETPDGAVEQLLSTPLAEQFDHDCQTWSDVIALCERFQPVVDGEDTRSCRSNALRCAVELSILDAFGRLFQQPVSAVTSEFAPADAIRFHRDRVRYSTTIAAEDPRAATISAIKMRVFGFHHCKVKVGVQGTDDVARLRRIRWWMGRRVEFRLDANEAWHASEAAGKIEPLLPFDIKCIEQPIPHTELESMSDLRKQVPVDLMLDESLTSLVDAQLAIDHQACDMFNIRLSKCGGFLNSLRIAALARENGLTYQLGCHPGESGILSAAGRHWATSVRDIRYLEGSYDRYFLNELLTNEDITINYGGRAPALVGPGLGVTPRPDVLARMTLKEQSFPLN